jgi:antitoxin ParD1/3/4
MNISLTPELERLVEKRVKSGLYASASEVIREGLRLLEEQEELKQQRLAEVRQKIDRGLDQLEKGLGIPGSEARARLRRKRA